MIAQTISLKIENVRQGCPIVPYIFIIVGKMLIHIIKKKYQNGGCRGFPYQGEKTIENFTIQCVDESSFIIRGDKQYVDELARLLKVFSIVSSMEINWEK